MPDSNLHFDYNNQAWVRNGVYVRCGHPESMNCGCYGRLHEGKPEKPDFRTTVEARSLISYDLWSQCQRRLARNNNKRLGDMIERECSFDGNDARRRGLENTVAIAIAVTEAIRCTASWWKANASMARLGRK